MQKHEIFEEDNEVFVYHPTYKNVEEKATKREKRKEEEQAKKYVEKKTIEYTQIDLDQQHKTKSEYKISMIKWGCIFLIEIIVFICLRKNFSIVDLLYPLFIVVIVIFTKTCVFLYKLIKMKNGTFKRSYYELPPIFSNLGRIIFHSVIMAFTLGFAIYSFFDFARYNVSVATVANERELDNGNVKYTFKFSIPNVVETFSFSNDVEYTKDESPYAVGDSLIILYNVFDPSYAKVCPEYYVSLRTIDYGVFVYCSFGLGVAIVDYIRFKKKNYDLIEDLL